MSDYRIKRFNTKNGDRAFSLIELMIAIAIIALLAAIIFAAFGSAREKGRRSVCLSNLRQIGVAIALYRQDFDGAEVTGGVQTATALGLPTRPSVLKPYVKDDRIYRCPNQVRDPNGLSAMRHVSYAWGIWNDDTDPTYLFSKWVEKRGDALPIIICGDHDIRYARHLATGESYFLQFLRLNGAVEGVTGKEDDRNF